MWDPNDVRRAITLEQEHAKQPLVFKVQKVRRLRGLLRLEVLKKPERSQSPLDESLEDARAWWPGDLPGNGLVKMANPDDSEIVIKPVEDADIKEGAELWVYPFDFLQALLTCWKDETLARRALDLVSLREPRIVEHPSQAVPFPLRAKQKDALGLTGSQIGLLHGPPGTGKTYTLGVNIARLLAATNWRILITATTNSAVDQALISADDALARMGRKDLRRQLARAGSGFDPARFEKRRHLIPTGEDPAFEDLRLHGLKEPSRRDLERWIPWKDEERAIRAKLRSTVGEVVRHSRVIAATSAAMLNSFEAFNLVPWDFLVVDEASQLTGASAAMLGTLAERVLFAGDPKQLPAVVQSQHLLCQRYLGKTAFDVFKDRAPFVRLNEQSRMAPDICTLVSNVFYRGELVVARDLAADNRWLLERKLDFAGQASDSPIRIVSIDTESQWSTKYQGRIRYESAQAAVAVAEKIILSGIPEDDIWILTPFRAQRALLRATLRHFGRKHVGVSTVHRAQGGERRVVLFDPVHAANRFLDGPLGDRLLNVAISRAMAQVCVFVSPGDLNNQRVKQIVELASSLTNPDAPTHLPTILDLLKTMRSFNDSIGQVVSHRGVVGTIVEFQRAGKRVVLRCRESGALRTFDLARAE